MINILWVGKQRCSNTNTVFLKHQFFTQKLHVQYMEFQKWNSVYQQLNNSNFEFKTDGYC